jgi:hypothetical protein
MATYFYESEMALISESMQQCGQKALDNAGIVRDACFRQLKRSFRFSARNVVRHGMKLRRLGLVRQV